MRKSISIAVVAFAAGAAFSTWTFPSGGASARDKVSGVAAQTINTLELTMKAKDLPVQQFDAF